jgi:UTP--glucose-1-phosphate uridylyltransferase
MLCLGESLIGEGLTDLDGLTGFDELIYVDRHSHKDIRHQVQIDTGRVAFMQVRHAVIPAAGMGTRFLPATKAVPKELLPIGDTPAIQFVIDEALGAGIDHIVVVSSRHKPGIESYFEPRPDLVEALRSDGREMRPQTGLAAVGRDWRVSIVYQDEPRGLGHAVGCAETEVGDEPFAVLLPDEIMGDSSLCWRR